MKRIRETIKERDGAEDTAIDEMFEWAREDLDDGFSADAVLSEVFGLEPDYYWDDEFQNLL